MTAVRLTRELEAWAEAEVAAGRAASVDAIASQAVDAYRREVEYLRALVAEADADPRPDIPAEEVFAELEAWFADEERALQDGETARR